MIIVSCLRGSAADQLLVKCERRTDAPGSGNASMKEECLQPPSLSLLCHLLDTLLPQPWRHKGKYGAIAHLARFR